MHNKKDYIIVKDRHPRFSEVLNDCCVPLCVPAGKNEPLSSVLQKICGKITTNYTTLTTRISELETEVGDIVLPVYAVEEGDGVEITGVGSEGDPWVFSSTIVDTNFAIADLTATATRNHNFATFGLNINNLAGLQLAGPTGSVGSISFFPLAASGDISNTTVAQLSASSTHTPTNGN